MKFYCRLLKDREAVKLLHSSCDTMCKMMTITFGSILLMKIRKVKKDANDVTLAIPSAILPGLNADFDGDVLNTLSMPLSELSVWFRGFSPENMLIDRVTERIRYDCSALENITLAILSDK